MKITRETVEHVAHLARLKLSQSEIAYYEEQLSKILGYVSKLNDLQSSPEGESLQQKNVISEAQDMVSESSSSILEAALVQAPSHIGTAYQVPRILD